MKVNRFIDLLFLFLITLMVSCTRSQNSPDKDPDISELTQYWKTLENQTVYEITKEKSSSSPGSVRIDVRINKRYSKKQLEEIAIEIKRTRTQYSMFWIFYHLSTSDPNSDAWATTHFTPELKVEILGSSLSDVSELQKQTVTGTILLEWRDSDPLLESKIYLVKEGGKYFIKTVFGKSAINSKVSEMSVGVKHRMINGQNCYNTNNNFGEYYLIEGNGNLGIYDRDGKIKEATKLNR